MASPRRPALACALAAALTLANHTPPTRSPRQPPSEPSELIEDLTAKFKLRSAMANLVSSRKPIALMKADKPKKKRKLNIRHITNVHMAHLLADTAQYTSID